MILLRCRLGLQDFSSRSPQIRRHPHMMVFNKSEPLLLWFFVAGPHRILMRSNLHRAVIQQQKGIFEHHLIAGRGDNALNLGSREQWQE